MSYHWKVLSWMVAGVVLGLALQWWLPAPAWAGLEFADRPDGIEVVAVDSASPAAQGGPVEALEEGDVFRAAVLHRGAEDERLVELSAPSDFEAWRTDEDGDRSLTDDCVLGASAIGEVIWLLPASSAAAEDPFEDAVPLTLGMDPESTREAVLRWVRLAADLFMALLKMLIVPLVLSSIVTGVAKVGSMKDLRRLGGKTFAYYISTSLLAILLGQALVNMIQPGRGASLGLSPLAETGAGSGGDFVDVLKRMVPANVFEAFRDNSAMLSIIFFALLLGFFITQAKEPHSSRIRDIFESFFEVMMKLAEGVLKLLPYGVFALMLKVTATTGFAPFKALLLYMFTVTLALVIHFCVTLPLLLRFIGGINPVSWFRAMSPAMMTAFSTSSSNMTLPVTLKAVEERGRVSNKVTSFTLPLGATINMDGTALYECIGVIFLAQFYDSISPTFNLTLGDQAFVVVMALLASVGAAGIPSAGLVMMLTILSALKLPLEGAALLLAVDRPLDMMRTMVNVWSDSCGAAIVARTEGEEGPLAPIMSG